MCIVTRPPDEGVGDAEQRPDDERERQADFRADFVNHPAGDDGHAGVKRGEKGGQIGEVRVGPAEAALGLRRRAEDGSFR